ncbi:MAG TPA: antibiotic ABC transporter ATP-binding protein [Blastocatellia bacterium]|jgi:ATP-binding cassette subfamily B protein|nr:antibiotic ABC transporter ATP-binding protein [Blastocatellia bacterium]HAF23814.1 antibiotic ABC transporter ATP-binding protein [Blastocatellia bacterium]HCX30659.1 antibiotic ABC transporter ATP-binding protein [Blastocatellia bacterium]
MSAAVKQFHEEEAIGKTYDFQIARRLLRYLRPYLRLLIPALVLTLMLNLLGILQPKFTQYAIDWYILPRKYAGLELLVGLYVGVQLLRLAFSYFQALLLNTVGQYVMFDMRRELYDKLQHQEVAYYDRNPVGRIMTRLTTDVDSLNELFTAGITDLLGDLVMIFAIIGVMLWMDVRLTLVTLLTVPMLWAATTWFRKGARKGYDMVRTRIARINSFLQEHFAGAQTVQIFNAERKSLEKFREINADYRKANLDTIFYYAVFFPLVDFIGAAGIALIIWYGGYQVMQNTPEHTVLTLGALVAFIQYSSFLFQPIRDISDKYNVLQAAVVASHRIFKTLDLPVAITSPAKPARSGRAVGHIEFENVYFAYKGEDWVLKDVSFKVEPGQSIALVGHTGSGKSTITNLLMRFYDVQRGRILLDGVDLREWDLKSLRENFAVVLQEIFLFSGTIEGNIRLGRNDITEERVRWAAQEVHAEQFVKRLKSGYQAEVKERGAGLSVGQKQLISFARALAFDPAILILDEATSSIDTETEQLIQQAIERVMRNRTSIVVAHRLSTIQRADQIIVLHHGEIREQGTHQELLAQHGLYWRLYKLQYADGARAQISARPSEEDAVQPAGQVQFSE